MITAETCTPTTRVAVAEVGRAIGKRYERWEMRASAKASSLMEGQLSNRSPLSVRVLPASVLVLLRPRH